MKHSKEGTNAEITGYEYRSGGDSDIFAISYDELDAIDEFLNKRQRAADEEAKRQHYLKLKRNLEIKTNEHR
jgi:hypothetical protein